MDVSKFIMPDGQQLDVKDATARAMIDGYENMRHVAGSIVTIGDSYGRGVGGTEGQGWPFYLGQELEVTNLYNYSNSGAGFVAQGHSENMNGMTFSDQITYAADQLKLKGVKLEDIDAVVIGGGWNDHSKPEGQIKSAVNDTLTKAQNTFKNARVYCYGLSNSRTDLGDMTNVNYQIIYYANRTGCVTSPYSSKWLIGHPDFDNGDGIHPNNNGYIYIGANIAASMRGNVVSHDTPATAVKSGASVTSSNLTASITSGIVCVCGEVKCSTVSTSSVLGVLSSAFKPSKSYYVMCQVFKSGYKDICPVYFKPDGNIEPRTPLVSGKYPTGEATVYIPPTCWPVGRM